MPSITSFAWQGSESDLKQLPNCTFGEVHVSIYTSFLPSAVHKVPVKPPLQKGKVGHSSGVMSIIWW